jgi:hypothetical protein
MVTSPRVTLLQHHRLARPLVILLSVSAITSVLYLAPAPTQRSHLVESIRVRWKLHGLSLRSGYLSRIPLDDLVRLSRNIPRVRQSTIPKLIHQSYKDTTLPNDFKDYQKSWNAQHPSWTYQFWTDEVRRSMPVSLVGNASLESVCDNGNAIVCVRHRLIAMRIVLSIVSDVEAARSSICTMRQVHAC